DRNDRVSGDPHLSCHSCLPSIESALSTSTDCADNTDKNLTKKTNRNSPNAHRCNLRIDISLTHVCFISLTRAQWRLERAVPSPHIPARSGGTHHYSRHP